MRLGVENLAGRFFYVEVEDQADVAALKKEIGSNDDEIQESRVLLILSDSNELIMDDDRRKVKDYGVEDGSIIYLFFSIDDPIQWPEIYEEKFTSLSSQAWWFFGAIRYLINWCFYSWSRVFDSLVLLLINSIDQTLFLSFLGFDMNPNLNHWLNLVYICLMIMIKIYLFFLFAKLFCIYVWI